MFNFKNKKGLTLVELLVTVFILSVGILSTLLFFTNAIISTEYARDLTVATSHGEYILEEMQTRATLANITGTDWSTWFNAQSVDFLPSETIMVTYVNSTSDPLDITTTIAWTKKNRTNNVSLQTKVTK